MAKIPLALRLKKRAHRGVAAAQDLLVKELYNFFGDAVLHGGTAIWRCYGGERFSEDVDVYIPKDEKRINALFAALETRGFVIKKKKIGDNSLYSNLAFGDTEVRLEALFKRVSGSLKEYEASDGNLITVYTLTPEELVKEKVSAYLARRKVRDLYDIFFLLRHVKDRDAIAGDLKRLAGNFKTPVDESELKVLIIEGVVPGIEKMLEYIRRW